MNTFYKPLEEKIYPEPSIEEEKENKKIIPGNSFDTKATNYNPPGVKDSKSLLRKHIIEPIIFLTYAFLLIWILAKLFG